ncbi:MULTISPECIES: L,D-transpeptidase family protein [Shewanella]|uniref:L,D-transpeptidase family protein n=1 Tax=Shewanella salipaludis TaxID=2723052 RepID=A0A972JLQ4_9GAMM|nr:MULTISPECIES: L,D-transpeptidase family protein [Shewanella]MCE9684874.1 L,D-transpeptidase family protein [Shewanella sp. AS16]NMH64326.1 L,D-transpeptidase family protein [Shewanella salipaludis]
MRFTLLSAAVLLSQLLSLPLQASSSPAAVKVDLVVVTKSENSLVLLRNGEIVKKYHIAMGDTPAGHKLKEGDQRTPQGRYLLDYKKSDSAFYKSIHISYPNEEDKLRAQALGLSPGGMIMIHGQNPRSSLPAEEAQRYNWTNGCIAVTNKEMDEIWQAIDAGTPIEIWP